MKYCIFMIFLAVLPALEAPQNLTLQKFHGLKMTEKRPKTLFKLYGLSFRRTIRSGRFTSLNGYTISVFKQILKLISPMAINVQWISLTHELLHFIYLSVRGVLFDLIDVLGHFMSFCNQEICKVKFADTFSAGKAAKVITKIL